MNKSEIQKLKNEIKSKREELKSFCQEQFKLGGEELFEQNPTLKSFSFKGFIPYFNDGDTCEYSADIDYPDINGESGYDIEYDEDKKELIPLQEKVKDFLQNFDDEFYESVFGSHAEVTVTKDQIKIKEYTNHD
jgi:phage host-nuclease inhibitor protein Gam